MSGGVPRRRRRRSGLRIFSAADLDRMSEIDLHFFVAPAKPTVEARVRRLNPALKEGDRVRGRFHKPMSWRRAKRLWLAGRFPEWCRFMSPGGKQVVHSIFEDRHPGDFLRPPLPTADCPLPRSAGAPP